MWSAGFPVVAQVLGLMVGIQSADTESEQRPAVSRKLLSLVGGLNFADVLECQGGANPDETADWVRGFEGLRKKRRKWPFKFVVSSKLQGVFEDRRRLGETLSQRRREVKMQAWSEEKQRQNTVHVMIPTVTSAITINGMGGDYRRMASLNEQIGIRMREYYNEYYREVVAGLPCQSKEEAPRPAEEPPTHRIAVLMSNAFPSLPWEKLT